MRVWPLALVIVLGLVATLITMIAPVVVFPGAYSVTGVRQTGDGALAGYAAAGAKAETVEVNGRRGVLIRNGDTCVVYFHGNAETALARPLHVPMTLSRIKYSVLVAEYPGYGTCTGTPSLDALVAEAPAWVEAAVSLGFGRVVVFASSIGSFPGIAAAQHSAVKGLVVDSGISSLDAFLPGWAASVLLHSGMRHSNADAIRAVSAPTLIVHSKGDTIVSATHAEALAKARGVQVLWREGTHNTSPFTSPTPIIQILDGE